MLIIESICLAYNTNDTEKKDEFQRTGGHEEITGWSVTLAAKEGISADANALKMAVGAEDSGTRPLGHFYNPNSGQGLCLVCETAKHRANRYYQQAVESRSYSMLGGALHLLQDMAAPSHANSAPHLYPEPTSWSVSLAGLHPGETRLQAEAYDLAGNRTTAAASIHYVPKAPEVSISADPQQLWPPNKKLIPITISGNVVTFGTDLKEITISVADEYGTYNQQGLKFGDTVLLEAWRNGNDMDGRMYTIIAVVTDLAGNRTTKSTTAVVPHDMGK